MDRLVAPKPPPLSPTQAAVRALEQLMSDLEARYRIRRGQITANGGAGVLVLLDLPVWCDRGRRFTWIAGYDELNRPELGEAPIIPLREAADMIAARYREIHGAPPAWRAG